VEFGHVVFETDTRYGSGQIDIFRHDLSNTCKVNYSVYTTRWIREAVKIRQESQGVMNRDEGAYQLSHIYTTNYCSPCGCLVGSSHSEEGSTCCCYVNNFRVNIAFVNLVICSKFVSQRILFTVLRTMELKYRT